MLRTQISLTEEDRSALDAASARTGRSIAALIRDAVRQVYGNEESAEDDIASMRAAFGSWAHETVSGADWVDEVRSGSRLERAR